jgi:peptidoglycan/LPS O-acetylase OafA/YrhL
LSNKLRKRSSVAAFENLNGLRFIGALAVFIFHSFTLSREIWGAFYQTPVSKGIYQLASRGHYGVGLFFVLSGFLIVTLMLLELDKTQTVNIKNFFARRILRIWPVYFALVIFGFLLFPYLPFGKPTIHSLGYFSVFLSNLDEIWVGMNDSLTFLTVTWSVSVEEQFYLFLFLVLGLFPFLIKRKYIFGYLVAIILICLVFRLINPSDERVIYFHSFSVMSDLAIGGLLAFIVSANKHQFIFKLSRIQIIGIYIFGLTVLIFSHQIFQGYLVAIERIFQASFFAFVLLDQMFSNHSWFKADELPGFFFSGNLTYGFYMYHCVSLYYWAIFFQNHELTNSVMWFVLYLTLNFVTTYVVSLLSYYWLEKPFLRLKSYFRG